MAVGQPSSSSEDVRKQGNDLYKAHKYAEAIGCYQRAAELAPDQTAPLSNLSAALLEVGDYAACDEACSAGLAQLGHAPERENARQKLYLRQAKARLYSLQIDEVAAVVGALTSGEERTNSERTIQAYQASRAVLPDVKAVHVKIILDLPRYKPMM